MSLGVTLTSLFITDSLSGKQLRNAKLTVTGLTTGQANTVPHGLTDGKGNPSTPVSVDIEPTSLNNFYESQAADSTNIYVGVDGQAGTSCNIYVEY